MFLIQQQVSSKSVLKYFLLFCCFWAKKTKQKNQKEKRKKHAIKRICQKKEVAWIHRVEMSLVENVHHYFLCILASTHSLILSSSSNHQARTSSKLFHLIFGNNTPKCKFNVIFFSWFSVMLTLGTYWYSTICSIPPPKKMDFLMYTLVQKVF